MSDTFYTEEKSKYLQNNPTWHQEDSLWKANHIINLLKANKVTPKTVADVGCGAGGILVELSKILPEDTTFTGFDISGDAIKIAKARENKRLHFVQKNFNETKDKFDLLMLIDVFEHVEDYIGFIKACKKRAGFTVFHIPLDISVQSVLRKKLMHERKTVGHLHYFTKETALATLEDSGFKILGYFYTGATTDLPAKTWKSKAAVLPRKILFKLNRGLAARLMGGFSLMVLAK